MFNTNHCRRIRTDVKKDKSLTAYSNLHHIKKKHACILTNLYEYIFVCIHIFNCSKLQKPDKVAIKVAGCVCTTNE